MKIYLSISILILLSLLSSACVPVLLPTPTSTPTTTQTFTPSQTPKPTLTSTLTITLTPSPTLTWYQALEIINPDNAARISLIDRLGSDKENNSISAMSFSPDSSLLAVASCFYQESNQKNKNFIIRVWDVERKSLLFELKGHWGYIYSLAFSPDGSLLASGADDNTIQIWSMKTGEQVEKISFGTETNSLAFSNDGKYLAAGTYERGVRIWNTSDWSVYKKISLGKWGWTTGLSFSRDSTELAIASHNITSIIINMENGEVLYEIDEKQCGYVGYSMDDGLYLGCTTVINSAEKYLGTKFIGKILLWHPKEGKVYILYENDSIASMDPVRFSPDEKLFSIISDSPHSNKIMLVEISSGKEVFAQELSEGHIDKMSFSPDGRIIALGVCSTMSEIYLYGVR